MIYTNTINCLTYGNT